MEVIAREGIFRLMSILRGGVTVSQIVRFRRTMEKVVTQLEVIL